jgi:Family of unknown function (DUF6629)
MLPFCGCLSAEVDVLVGLAIGAIAIDGLRFVEHRRQLALAAIPVTLALHQLIEVGAWWGLQGRVPHAVVPVAVYLYLAIALVVVPVLVPASVWLVEADPRRRRWMVPFVALGIATGLVLAYALVAGPVSATIGGYYIDYRVRSVVPVWGSVAYVAAVAAPLLLSSDRRFAALGIVNVALVTGLGWLNANGYVSLWCAAAALESIVIVDYLRSGAGQPWALRGWLRSNRPPVGTG